MHNIVVFFKLHIYLLLYQIYVDYFLGTHEAPILWNDPFIINAACKSMVFFLLYDPTTNLSRKFVLKCSRPVLKLLQERKDVYSRY